MDISSNPFPEIVHFVEGHFVENKKNSIFSAKCPLRRNGFRQNGPLGEMSFGEKDFQRKVRIPLKSTMSRCFCFSFLVIFKNFLITQSFEKFMAYYKFPIFRA
ncbi:unnamed protein product [Rhizophagus irregularis]|uniref:Uncharacterized protein n=1 Tax=Rhizophagus irregularis TaxID=588596 RepID=A0A916EE38_9GLOM|nr:unnamed protein product [Rhizophagus irregularis]